MERHPLSTIKISRIILYAIDISQLANILSHVTRSSQSVVLDKFIIFLKFVTCI